MFSPIASANMSSILCRKAGTTCITGKVGPCALGRTTIRNVQKQWRGEGETAIRNGEKRKFNECSWGGASEGFSYGKEGNLLDTCSHLAITWQKRILKEVSLL